MTKMGSTLEDLLAFGGAARNFCAGFVASAIKTVQGRTVNELFLAPTMILSRMVKLYDAIELLLQHRFVEEAAVLALTQFELSLDALFIGDTLERATEWMSHQSLKRQPWPVKTKIDDVYADDPEAKAANQEYFELLSAVKHGNPTAGVFGFSTRAVGDRVTVTNDNTDDRFSRTYALAVCGLSIYQMIEALAGTERAFGRFLTVDPSLSGERVRLLQECRHRIGRVMQAAGLIEGPTLH